MGWGCGTALSLASQRCPSLSTGRSRTVALMHQKQCPPQLVSIGITPLTQWCCVDLHQRMFWPQVSWCCSLSFYTPGCWESRDQWGARRAYSEGLKASPNPSVNDLHQLRLTYTYLLINVRPYMSSLNMAYWSERNCPAKGRSGARKAAAGRV